MNLEGDLSSIVEGLAGYLDLAKVLRSFGQRLEDDRKPLTPDSQNAGLLAYLEPAIEEARAARALDEAA